MLLAARQYVAALSIASPISLMVNSMQFASIVSSAKDFASTLETFNTRHKGGTNSWIPGTALMQFGRDLTEEARRGLLDPLVGRSNVVQRTVQILLRRTKNNPVLVGPAGVGKTAIVEGLAQLMAAPDALPVLASKRVIALDVTSLVAGSSYRGEFESRLQAVVRDVQAAQGRIVLFIDEIHMLVGAGASEGGLDAANILKPALARGVLQCIGATTHDEYRQYLEPDPALARRFQSVAVSEPTLDEALACLRGLAPRYAAHHGATFTESALHTAVHCASRFITERRLPDSAIDLMDQAAARVVLHRHQAPSSGCHPKHEDGYDTKPSGAGLGKVTHAAPLPHTEMHAERDTQQQDGGQQNSVFSCADGRELVATGSTSQTAPNHDWHAWVSRRRMPGGDEVKQQMLLEWFGATPAHPLPGPMGHAQTTDERLRRHAELFGMRHDGHLHSSRTPEQAVPKACPHCGTLVQAHVADVRLTCPSCHTRFLNIAPDKLMLGVSVVMMQSQQERVTTVIPGQHRGLCSQSAQLYDVLGMSTNRKSEQGALGCSQSACQQHAIACEARPMEGLVVSAEDILAVVAEARGVPPMQLRGLQGQRSSCLAALQALERSLQCAVVGQPEAVSACVAAVKLMQLGLGRSKRPAASLLLVGPPGVGKRTLCEALAREVYEDPQAVLHINMAQFADRNSITRLLGAPPGYVGYGQGGALTEPVRQRPHQLVLLQDAQRAHPEVVDLISKIIQDGKITDSMGRVADFSHCIVMLTVELSNKAELQQKSGTTSLGLQLPQAQRISSNDSVPAISSLANSSCDDSNMPEPVCDGSSLRQPYAGTGNMPAQLFGLPIALQQLCSQVDQAVWLQPLTASAVAQAVELSLAELQQRLAGHAVELQVQAAAKAWIAARAYSPVHGLRPLAGLVRQHVLTPVADWLLAHTAGGAARGGDVGAMHVLQVAVHLDGQSLAVHAMQQQGSRV